MPVDDISGGSISAVVDVNVASNTTGAGVGTNDGIDAGVVATTGRDTRGRQNAIWIKDVVVSARVRQAVLNMEAWRVEVWQSIKSPYPTLTPP